MLKPPAKIAILGSGPAGLEAALAARTLGYDVTLYEQGQIAEHVQRWGHVRMFTPFGLNATPAGKALVSAKPQDTDILTGKEYREAYLLPLAESSILKPCIQIQTSVLTIGRVGWRKSAVQESKKPLPPFRLLVRNAQNQERFETADVILDCTGTYSKPNWAGDGGIPAAGEIAARPHIAYFNDDILGSKRAQYANKSILLIGDSYSAATSILSLATLAEDQQSTWVIWLSHGAKGAPLPRIANDPLRERDRLAAKANSLACRCDGHLEFHALTHVEEIVSHGPDKGFRVSGTRQGQSVTWEVDRVIANVGYRPEMVLCQELRAIEPSGQIETSEPNYYILGQKSQGRRGRFLIQDAHAQIHTLFSINIATKPKAA
jgi:thioredoxin reductase